MIYDVAPTAKRQGAATRPKQRKRGASAIRTRKIVMVDRTLMVRRATPAARSAFNILPTDIGRRITELRPNINIPDLENILRDVTETLNTRERKVREVDGRDYWLRVRPYRTTDSKIDGAVITLVDLEGKKESYAAEPPNRAKQVSPRK